MVLLLFKNDNSFLKDYCFHFTAYFCVTLLFHCYMASGNVHRVSRKDSTSYISSKKLHAVAVFSKSYHKTDVKLLIELLSIS